MRTDRITITESALEKIKQLCEENNMPAVRPFIAGGGCAGMQHAMTFAPEKYDTDIEISTYVYIDPVAYCYMDGATIDFVNDGFTETFVFNDVFKQFGGSGTCGGCGAATGPGYSAH
jgi:iron-sulfur cluster assembly accessory protein